MKTIRVIQRTWKNKKGSKGAPTLQIGAPALRAANLDTSTRLAYVATEGKIVITREQH